MINKYPAVIHKEADSDFGVSFPDFPGCISAGRTAEEAHDLAEEVLQFHVDGLIEDRDEIPEPSALVDIVTQTASDDGVLSVLLVPVVIPPRVRRVNITIDERQLLSIDKEARRLGLSRSAFLAEGARRLIQSSNE